MEPKALPVVYSEYVLQCLEAIYEYGAETFSSYLAELFVLELIQKLDLLSDNYMHYTECRFLITRSRKYRMFAFSSYLVIYRITKERIEVLAIIHKSQSITKIRSVKRVKI